MDGAVVPAVQGGTTLWVYDLATNSLNFSPFGVPAPSAHIEVRYTPTCR